MAHVCITDCYEVNVDLLFSARSTQNFLDQQHVEVVESVDVISIPGANDRCKATRATCYDIHGQER